MRALYAGECTVVDRWFGRLVETADLLGLSEDTLIIFMSDHGHYLGYPNDGGQLGKATGYRKSDGQMASAEADVFTPLLDSVSNPIFMARLPGQAEGSVRQEMIQPPDFMPTILDFMKKPIPRTVQGSSILPLPQGKKQPWRTSVVSSSFRSFAQISDRRWLYGTWVHDHPPKLFDRRTDPDQKRDVFKKNPQVAKRLHRRLVSELKGLGSPEDFVEKINNKTR